VSAGLTFCDIGPVAAFTADRVIRNMGVRLSEPSEITGLSMCVDVQAVILPG
jgi:hypothetical protein